MPDYSVTFARSARKELEKLPPPIAARILDRIESLATSPRPPGSLKLKGEDRLWRIRVGDYRVIYEIRDRDLIVDVSIVRHRKDVYRDI
jgi:mRNA interferase RelE/StbE